MAADIAVSLFHLAMELKERVSQVAANKEECTYVGERIDVLVKVVRTFPKPVPLAKIPALEQLRTVLDSAINLVESFTEKKRFDFFRKLVHCNSDAEKFAGRLFCVSLYPSYNTLYSSYNIGTNTNIPLLRYSTLPLPQYCYPSTPALMSPLPRH